jgi:tetratricopeptide (TPR) repeat protein
MSSDSPRALPALQLPSAFLSFWPAGDPAAGDPAGDARMVQVIRAYADRQGVAQLDERTLALVPEQSREHVFDDALGLGKAILAHLKKIGAEGEVAGVLVYPGELRVDGTSLSAIDDELMSDLAKRPPRFKSLGMFLTGYAARWLRSRFQFDSAGLYEGPSGRRVPMHRVLGEAPLLSPWHNPELLGRQVKVVRPQVHLDLQRSNDGVLRVLGPLGSGKSHAVWHFLLEQEGPKLWFRVRRSLFGTAGLARRLVTELHRLAPESLPAGSGGELRRPEALTPLRAAELLSVWLDNTCQQLGATLWIVCDVVQSAVEGDLDLLANLLDRRKAVFRMLLISRSGGGLISQLDDLPQMVIPPMDEEELESLSEQLFNGLSLDQAIAERLTEASGGSPFALEEGLTDMVHRGLIRRVYGSFFYSGPSDTLYTPSRRLVRHVTAEIERLGHSLPLRILAAAEQAVPVSHLETACATFGVELPPGWETAFTGSGWLTHADSAWGEGLSFLCPAYRQALGETVSADSIENLRQALGQAMVSDTTSSQDLTWQTYQLMAGTEDALHSLLRLSKNANTAAAREEIFEALEREYRLHRSRDGDESTELDLLWKLLPLGHRLGKLSQLEDELERSLQLASGDETRFAALALVKAEHDQSQGRHRDAIKGIQAALLASEGADDPRRALILLRLGKILVRQEESGQVRRLFTDLLGLAGSSALGASCHFYLGEAALLERDLAAAEAHHEKALTMRRQQDQPKPLAASLAANAAVTLTGGNYPGAFQLYSQAKEILADSDDELADILLGMGRAQGHLGDSTAATPNLRRALELRQARGYPADIASARLALAKNHLDLGHLDLGLKEARRAHFDLSLLPTSTELGNAALLLGQVLFHSRQPEEAEDCFREACRVHLRYKRRQAVALDSSWLLQLALERNDKSEILSRSAELESMAEIGDPIQGDMVFYRLFLAFEWLRKRGTAARDPIEYLRGAHRELMRKLGFLEPQMRHQFLFNVREHQELLNAAAENQISMPSFSATAIIRDSIRS